ncbi:N-acetyltransferase family protein [Erythrobacter sp.]|uniref:GNAT family N-acetyltransferase n=1 Tax=Erythrobacter sp. TaxID=1042 RepID=UPI003120432D
MRLADIAIRPAVPADAAAVQAIYAFHVAHGTASFDTEAPDAAFWEKKIAHILARGWPFLAIEVDGVLAGYAYASQFRDRAAYAHTCENSIYIDPDLRGAGLGRRLLEALIDAARASGFEQMIAVIGGGEPASVALHARCGFEHAGRMKKVGRKFGRILDTVYMQRELVA